MKNIFHKKSRFFTCILMGLVPVWIQAVNTIGLVISSKGTVFSELNGRTKILRPGDQLEKLSDIFTEEGGKVEFSDYFDNRYFLAGSGHVQIKSKTIALKRGHLWIRSPGKKRSHFTIQTANSLTTYQKGESIISFDEQQRKTQLLTIRGNFNFGSITERIMTVSIQAGHFSFIKQHYNNERPREPVPIGLKSLKKVASLFDRSLPQESRAVQRSLASVSSTGNKASYLASSNTSTYKQTRVIVNIFGRSPQKAAPATREPSRGPASLSSSPISSRKNDSFESALLKQYKKQMRHKKEVNSLIDVLKSYKADYSKSY